MDWKTEIIIQLWKSTLLPAFVLFYFLTFSSAPLDKLMVQFPDLIMRLTDASFFPDRSFKWLCWFDFVVFTLINSSLASTRQPLSLSPHLWWPFYIWIRKNLHLCMKFAVTRKRDKFHKIMQKIFYHTFFEKRSNYTCPLKGSLFYWECRWLIMLGKYSA